MRVQHTDHPSSARMGGPVSIVLRSRSALGVTGGIPGRLASGRHHKHWGRSVSIGAWTPLAPAGCR